MPRHQAPRNNLKSNRSSTSKIAGNPDQDAPSFGISTQQHVIGSIKASGPKVHGHQSRYVALVHEAESYGCSIEKQRRRGYIFISEDTPAGGVQCKTMDELDEELDNWRV